MTYQQTLDERIKARRIAAVARTGRGYIIEARPMQQLNRQVTYCYVVILADGSTTGLAYRTHQAAEDAAGLLR